MKHVTTWRPDTCDCVISYEWDDQDPQETRVHTLKTIKGCDPHLNLPADQAYTQVVTENQLKNKVHGAILKNMPEVVDTQIDQDGNEQFKLKAGIEYQWSFDKDRNLKVSLKGVTASQKTALDALVSKHFEAGKVVAV